jgi:hypothetical protein
VKRAPLLLVGALLAALVGCAPEPRPSTARLLNKGAWCQVVDCMDDTWLLGRQYAGQQLSTDRCGGVFLSTGQPVIAVRGPITPAARALVHEYHHYLEHAFADRPDVVRGLRDCFRSMCTPAFELGRSDLMERLP